LLKNEKGSVLKTLVIVIGALIALALVGFIVLVAIELISPDEQTAEELVEEPIVEVAEPTAEEVSATTTNGNNTFTEPGYGYTISYPQHWIYEKDDSNSVIFSGPEGTDEYYTTVTVQTLFSTEAGGNYSNLDDIYQELYDQFDEMNGIFDLYEEDTHPYKGIRYPMIVFDTIYRLDGEDFWQYVILFERDQHAFHAVYYTVPLELIELSTDVFTEMLETFIFVPI